MKNLVAPRQGANLQEQRIIYVDRCGQGFSGLESTDHPSCAGPLEEERLAKHLRMCKTKNTVFMDQKDDGFTITMKCRDGPVKVLLEGTPTSKFDGGSKQLVIRSAHDKIEFSWKIPPSVEVSKIRAFNYGEPITDDLEIWLPFHTTMENIDSKLKKYHGAQGEQQIPSWRRENNSPQHKKGWAKKGRETGTQRRARRSLEKE
jgi:hypothetical protein